MGWLGFIPLPSGEALACPACGKHSRKEGRASRIVGVLFLGPFILLLGGGVATGIWMLGSMIFGEFSIAFAAAALGLIAVAGYLEYLAVRGARRLLKPALLLPMNQGLMTEL